jgi:large repetitive protein
MAGVNVVVTNADSSSTPCSGGNWSYTTAAQTVDGTRTYNFRQTDPAGNFTAISGTWTRNTNLPQLTLATTTPFYSNGNNTSFNGGCSNGLAITVTGAVNTSIACTSGTWTFPATQTVDGSYTYTFNQTDGFGNSTTVSMNWVRDTTGPSLSSMSLNSGAGVTNTSYVKVALNGSDSFTKVMKFCLKTTNTAPAANDSCWIAVNANPPGLTPALSLNLTNFSYYLGITPGIYTVYAWLQDAAGNTSTNVASTGVDRASIDYQIVYPPTLDTVFATNTNAPGFPIPSPQLSVSAGGFVYIKWRATSTSTLGSTPIKLSFTTDDVNWNTIANVANAAGSGCSLNTSSADASTTGCYRWSAPTSGFMRLKIEVADSGGRSTAVTPPPLNTGTFKLIAGNTEPGINTSTLSSVYIFRKQQHTTWGEPNAFAINTSGVLYVNDHERGILTVDPADGLTKVLIPKTGVSSADGPLSTATVRNVLGIVLDYNDRLLIWDNDRIRRVDFTSGTVTRIIGGGVSTAANIVNALDLAFEGYMPLPTGTTDTEFNWRAIRVAMVPLPNGDLYFGSRLDPWIDIGHKFRRYRESGNPQITLMVPTGYGHTGGTGANVANCAFHSMGMVFDPATSNIDTVDFAIAEHGSSSTTSCMGDGSHAPLYHLYAFETQADANWQIKAVQPATSEVATSWEFFTRITGRNGKLYGLRRSYARISAYNSAANTWSPIIGTGTNGQCPDGTAALSCDIDPQDMFVTAQNQIFFLDRGRIRTLDSSNRVVTLFGQSLSYGEGGDPILARFSKMWSLALENDGRLMVWDFSYLREVSADRASLVRVAGNGRPGWVREGYNAATSPFPNGQDWWKGILTLDPATNGVYTPILNAGDDHAFIGRLNRTTGQWEKVFGGGASGAAYHGTDGQVGNAVRMGVWGDFASNWPDGFIPVGFGNGKLLLSHSTYPEPNPAWSYNMLKLFNSADSWRQQHLVGMPGNGTDLERFCADGTNVNSCNSPIFYHMNRAQYDSGANKWLVLGNRSGSVANTAIRSVPDNDGSGNPRAISTLVTLPRIRLLLQLRRLLIPLRCNKWHGDQPEPS